jgi:hypothetical protein
MTNYFVGKSVEWLIVRRDVLQDLLAGSGGSETHIAIEPGMYDEFRFLTEEQLQIRLERILYALNQLDPDTYPNPAGQRCNLTLSQWG